MMTTNDDTASGKDYETKSGPNVLAAFVSRPWQSFRSLVYDFFIVSMTRRWYREVLSRLPPGSRVLDVGIGTGTSLFDNRDLIRSKSLHVVGVDYDAHYIAAAQASVERLGLSQHVEVVHASILDYEGGPFDAVYFSGSFMIIPDKVTALQRCAKMLHSAHPRAPPVAPSSASSANASSEGTASAAVGSSPQHSSAGHDGTGRFYFTQTFERDGWFGRRVTPWVKYALKNLLTIDFGAVTFEQEFRSTLHSAGVVVEEFVVLQDGALRSEVLVVAMCP